MDRVSAPQVDEWAMVSVGQRGHVHLAEQHVDLCARFFVEASLKKRYNIKAYKMIQKIVMINIELAHGS